jgi:ABC-2 type transport system permease protein
MKAQIDNILDSLYIAWAIAAKDIAEALKNRNTLVNIILIMGLVGFFFWMSTLRPFDQRIEVVLYDEGQSELPPGSAELPDGITFKFEEAASLEEMKSMLRYEHIGIVVPAGFDQALAAGQNPTLVGYILWPFRNEAAELEVTYGQKLSELLGHPVQLSIGGNIVIPAPDVQTTSVQFHLLYAVFFMAIIVIAHLMMEERRARTMEALLVSPASAGQVVMGKAFAGGFYVLLVGGLWFLLHWAYIVNWGLALGTFLLLALFSIGLGLVLGSFIKSPQQLSLWILPVVFLLVVPAFFSSEPTLVGGLRSFINWLPSSALMTMMRFAMSSHAPLGQLAVNLAIVLISSALVYGLVVWQLRRSDR